MQRSRLLLWACALTLACAPALAQKTASQGIDEYRAMLQDGNPADLFEAKGEGLWSQKRGPKNASLEKCDLGKGPGVVKGVFVELPRYFADTAACRTWSPVCSPAWKPCRGSMLQRSPGHLLAGASKTT